MSATNLRYIVIALTFLLVCNQAEGQSVPRVREIYREHPPKFVLVEILTHQRKREYYKKSNQPKNLQQVKFDTDSVIAKMTLDFHDNFTFCPYYFFYDTCLNKVIKGNLDGILFDKNMVQLIKSPVDTRDTTHFIIRYGILTSDDRYSVDPDPGAIGYSYDQILKTQPNLIVFDYKFNQLPKGTVRRSSGRRGLSKDEKKAYRYISPTLNIVYYPSASALSNNFKSFYGKKDGWDQD